MPNAIVRPRFASGRSAIGSSGWNFVSTVMIVIVVPPTQIRRWPVISPASTDAISSSVASNTVPPVLLDDLDRRVAERDAGDERDADDEDHERPPAAAPSWRRDGATSRLPKNSIPPTTALMIASPARVAGEPISGMTRNGSTNVATSEPAVLTASRVPVADALGAASPRPAARPWPGT